LILLRPMQEKDITDLLEFANTPGMFNLPKSREAALKRLELSQTAFDRRSEEKGQAKFVFVAEDLDTGQILGTSMIAGKHGTPDVPHYYFKVGQERRYSNAVQAGFIHGTLTLKIERDGPSELGALVVRASHRGHPSKVGKQIVLVRFLFLAQHRDLFEPSVIAELLPPLDVEGHSPLWESIGRRFTNLDYWEADALAAKNKEFITDLFPRGKIYTTFLTADARNAIGKVAGMTEPLFHLLKKIGFRYNNEIDPFDGGPHLRAKVDQIAPVRSARVFTVKLDTAESEAPQWRGMIAPEGVPAKDFRAVMIEGRVDGGDLYLRKNAYEVVGRLLGVTESGKVRGFPL
jgi:arginine N-succinyltransferase